MKRKKGYFIGAFAVYGYIKDSENHNKLVIDDNAAFVVRDIFRWRIDGMSCQGISNRLNDTGILSPYEYKRELGMQFSTVFKRKSRALWSAVAVSRILKNEVYIGTLEQGKKTSKSYKVRERIEKSKEEWIKVENTHEPIVSVEDFVLVAQLLKHDVRVAPNEETVYLFSGLLKCAECKRNMVRKLVPSGDKKYLIQYKPALELAERVKDTIDNLFADKAALSKELVTLGVSRRHMTEIFANQYGQTPNEYLNVRRLETAKMQLDDDRRTILEIALSLGFESLSSFYAFFKKHAGVPPGDYRRRNATAAGGSFFTYDLALGKISIAADGGGIVAVQFADHLETYGARQSNRTIDTAARQLDEYFSGRRKAFELPLAPAGTPFQQKVWAALQHIPYGETQSYKQVAGMIGNPNASRAVGMANNKNPLLVVIPCHRVVGADGSLVGYAASLETKKQLLELEQQTGGVII